MQVILQADFLAEQDNPDRAAVWMVEDKRIGSNHLREVRAPVAAQMLQCVCRCMIPT